MGKNARGGGGPEAVRIVLPEGPRDLFEAVEPVISRYFGASRYRLGGGTALAAVWAHRHSTDVDLFAEPSHYQEVVGRAGRELERALFDEVGGLVPTRSWVEPEHIHLDFDEGEVTLIPAVRLVPRERQAVVVEGSEVPVEEIEEILAKEIRLRMLGAGSYLVRNLYDVACAARRDPEALRRALAGEGSRRLRQIADELSALDDFEGTLIRPVENWSKPEIRDEVVAICRDAVGALGA